MPHETILTSLCSFWFLSPLFLPRGCYLLCFNYTVFLKSSAIFHPAGLQYIFTRQEVLSYLNLTRLKAIGILSPACWIQCLHSHWFLWANRLVCQGSHKSRTMTIFNDDWLSFPIYFTQTLDSLSALSKASVFYPKTLTSRIRQSRCQCLHGLL